MYRFKNPVFVVIALISVLSTGIINAQKATWIWYPVFLKAACWNFNSPDNPPSQYKLATRPMSTVSSEKKNNGMLYDFGKETFGYPKFYGLKGNGTLNIYYGESPEEALSTDHCETLDRLPTENDSTKDLTVSGFKSLSKPVCKNTSIKVIGYLEYEITILKDQEIVVKYTNAD